MFDIKLKKIPALLLALVMVASTVAPLNISEVYAQDAATQPVDTATLTPKPAAPASATPENTTSLTSAAGGENAAPTSHVEPDKSNYPNADQIGMEEGEAELGENSSFDVNQNPPLRARRIDGPDPMTDETALEQVKNPPMPTLYSLTLNFKGKKIKNGKETDPLVLHDPYQITVGENAWGNEWNDVHTKVKLFPADGYTIPGKGILAGKPDYSEVPRVEGEGENKFVELNYDNVVNLAKAADNQSADNQPDDTGANLKKAEVDYLYEPETVEVEVNHTFQSLAQDNKGEYKYFSRKNIAASREKGYVGEERELKFLPDDQIEGFMPEPKGSKIVFPSAKLAQGYTKELRYLRQSYEVNYDTQGGTSIPPRKVRFGQRLPIPAEPELDASYFLGWITDKDLYEYTEDGSKKEAAIYKHLTEAEINQLKSEIANSADGGAAAAKKLSKSLSEQGKIITTAQLRDPNGKYYMPAGGVTFTAIYKFPKDVPYTVYYWQEKANHPDRPNGYANIDEAMKDFDLYTSVQSRAPSGTAMVKGTAIDQTASGDGSTPASTTTNQNQAETVDLAKKHIIDLFESNCSQTDLRDKFYYYGGIKKLPEKYKNKSGTLKDWMVKTGYKPDFKDVADQESTIEITNQLNAGKNVLPNGKSVYNVFLKRRVYTFEFHPISANQEDKFRLLSDGAEYSDEKPYTIKTRFFEDFGDKLLLPKIAKPEESID